MPSGTVWREMRPEPQGRAYGHSTVVHTDTVPTGTPLEVRKLRRHLLWLALGLMLVSGLLVITVLVQQRAQALDSGKRLNESLARVAEVQAASAIKAVDQQLQLTVQGLALLDAAGNATNANVRALLGQQAAALPFVRAIWWLDAQGRVLHAPEASTVGLQLADRDFFQASLRDPQADLYLGSPVRSRATGQWLISAARPLRSASGAFAGVLVAGLDPPYFARLWQTLDLGTDGVVVLLRRDGQLMLRSPHSDAAMGQRLALPGLQDLSGPLPDGGHYSGSSPVDGRNRLAAWRRLADPPDLLVLVARSEGTVLAPWRQQALLAGSIWSVSVIVVGLLLFALERSWRQRLRAAAQERQTAAWLALATEAANIGVWDWDVEHDRWHASPTWYSMLGQSRKHGPDDHMRALDAVHPDDLDMVAASLQAVLDGAAGTCFYQTRVQHADGAIRWVEIAGQVTGRDAAGKPTHLIGTRIDTTKHQQLLQQLQAGEARFRSLFELAAVGVAHVTLEGAFALVNQRFADITGRSRAALQACSFQQITHADDIDTDLDHVRRLLAGDITTYAMEKRYWRPDQSLVWVNLTVSLVRDAAGSPLHFISAVEDITDRKQAERTLQDQLTELQRWHSAMMGRELRTAEMKREVNALLAAAGQPARYPSVESLTPDSNKGSSQ